MESKRYETKNILRDAWVKLWNLYYWLAKSKNEDPAFVPLGKFPIPTNSIEINLIVEIITSNGNTIRFFQTILMEAIKKLVNL